MSGFVIFEGPDAAGKTTLAKGLASHLSFRYESSIPAELQELRAEADMLAQEDSLAFYLLCNALQARRTSAAPGVVLDRYVFSTAAYHCILLGRNLDDHVYRQLSEPTYAQPTVIVYVTAAAEVRRERAAEQDTLNRWFELSLLNAVEEEYSRLLSTVGIPVLEIDTTALTEEQALAYVISRLEATKIII